MFGDRLKPPKRSKMSNKRIVTDEEPENPLSLSFLDALSCGLAATLALFLIFVVLPHGEMIKEASGQTKGVDSEESRTGARSRILKSTPENAPLAIHIFINSINCEGDLKNQGGLKKEDISWDCKEKEKWYPFFVDLNIAPEDKVAESDNASKVKDTGYILGGFTLSPSLKSKKVKLRINNDKINKINSFTVDIVGAITQKAVINRTTSFDISNANVSFVDVLIIDRLQKDSWIRPASGFEIQSADESQPSQESQGK